MATSDAGFNPKNLGDKCGFNQQKCEKHEKTTEKGVDFIPRNWELTKNAGKSGTQT
jgi:hypothetical protein